MGVIVMRMNGWVIDSKTSVGSDEQCQHTDDDGSDM